MIEFTLNSSVQFAKDTIHFNGGELHPTLKIKESHNKQPVQIFALIKTAQDIMELAMIKDAVDRLVQGKVAVNLRMPYIPYARQDRVANPGEALGIKVFADMLNAMKFNRVTVVDSHSPVALALIDNVKEESQAEVMQSIYDLHAQDIVLAPDAGALKKAEKFAEKIGLPLLTATKNRNTLNGELSAPSIQFTNQLTPEYVKHRIARGGRIIIVDDICDGGGTFIQLGKMLAELGLTTSLNTNAGTLYKGAVLLVTHGIFARDAKYKLNTYFEEVKAVHDWTKGE